MINYLILASKSPQRKMILRDLGIGFKAVPADIDEHTDGLTKWHAIAKSIARRKAEKVAEDYPADWVLGSDTFVVMKNGKLALKPKDREDARRTINLYRNSYCDVYSGLALINKSLQKQFVGHEKTRIFFRDFSDEDREGFLDSGEWKNRSGSMTVEGKCGKWIKRMKGEYWNVVGLPVELLKKFLNHISSNG
jgi:septum formation protein